MMARTRDSSDDDAPRERRVTARDVADLAGVSVGTVSNVVNRPDRVSPKVLERVHDAMSQLGWSRNQVAQQLRGGRSSAIGAVVVELSPHTVGLIDAIERALVSTGFTLQVTTTGHDWQREMDRVELFAEQRVRGILLSPVQNFYEFQLNRLESLQIPLVVLGRAPRTTDLCAVSSDDAAGGRLVINHLVERGHRRIAMVGGRADNYQVRTRLAGARDAAPADVALTVLSSDTYDAAAGQHAAAQIAALGENSPTALFAINDLVAIGLQHGLQSAGIRVPTDISVVGYDDISFAQTAPIALTTIRNPHLQVAQEATGLLLAKITAIDTGAPHRHQQILVQPELVIRESTAARQA
jgi:LacI family transcriptional regulator